MPNYNLSPQITTTGTAESTIALPADSSQEDIQKAKDQLLIQAVSFALAAARPEAEAWAQAMRVRIYNPVTVHSVRDESQARDGDDIVLSVAVNAEVTFSYSR